MEMAKILELKKLKITITERFILMDDRMLDLARLRILRLEENSFGIEDKGFDLSYRNHLNPTIKILRAKSLLSHWLYRILIFERHLEGINVILFRGNITIIKWGTSSRWSSSIYCPMRNSDEMTERRGPLYINENFNALRHLSSHRI